MLTFASTSFNTASGMDCMQFFRMKEEFHHEKFQYRKRYGLHAIPKYVAAKMEAIRFQYRKRYGLHAIKAEENCYSHPAKFQYRKRYGLHAILFDDEEMERGNVSIPQAVWIACNKQNTINMTPHDFSFNTASGMDCMQLISFLTLVKLTSFNTASGMDCMQFPNAIE